MPASKPQSKARALPNPGSRGQSPRALLACALLLLIAHPADAQLDLDSYTSKHYTIHTDLTKAETRLFGKHMDRVFDAYQRKFANIGLESKRNQSMPLYLFRTRDAYVAFCNRNGMDGRNSGGMFFYRPHIHGLATYIQDRPLTETFSVLQHEGFHQFAFSHIGPRLPIWVNEGLAQYFEDGVFEGNKLHLDLANARRVESVKKAIRTGRIVPFDKMLAMSDDDWGGTLNTNAAAAGLLYDQAWSMVFFLATADDGKYIQPFRDYLHDVARGRDSMMSFRDAFRLESTDPFEKAWQRHAHTVEPDGLNVTLHRMNFLGHALQFMHENKIDPGHSLSDVRTQLRRIGYRIVWMSHGVPTEVTAHDETVYRFPVGRGERAFLLLEPTRDDLPPRLSAPGLNPEPTLEWDRDATGHLMQAIVYR